MAHKIEHALVDSWKPENKGDEIEGSIFIMTEIQFPDNTVPAVELIDKDGVPFQVLMGNYALERVILNPAVVEGGYLYIRYDGDSTTIQKAGNYAKKFSVAYYAPGDWKIDNKGECHGTPTVLRPPTKRRAATHSTPTPAQKSMGQKQDDVSPDPNFEEPSDSKKASKRKPKAK